MLIKAINVSLAHGDKIIFKDASFSIDRGELMIVGGPSGSGKSSLLRLLNRLHDPVSGTIFFDGIPLTDYKPAKLRQQVCYLQQAPIMVDGTIKHNLTLPFSFSSMKEIPHPGDDQLLGFLHQFGLTNIKLSDDAAALSVGQKQRLAFIRALLLKPKALLLDEPTSALDPESRRIVEDTIETLAIEQNIAVIMITHLDFRPSHISARRYLLDHNGLTEQAS